MMPLIRNTVVSTLAWALLHGSALGQPDCNEDLDACVRLAVVEAAAYADECGKLLRGSKDDLDAAFARWSVLKLQVPGLQEAIKPGSPERAALGRKVASYLKSIGSYERDIECSSRLAMMKSRRPKLFSDSVTLPRDPLDRYLQDPLDRYAR